MVVFVSETKRERERERERGKREGKRKRGKEREGTREYQSDGWCYHGTREGGTPAPKARSCQHLLDARTHAAYNC